MGEVDAFWSLPFSFKSRLSFLARYAGGKTGSFCAFLPVTSESQEDVYEKDDVCIIVFLTAGLGLAEATPAAVIPPAVPAPLRATREELTSDFSSGLKKAVLRRKDTVLVDVEQMFRVPGAACVRPQMRLAL